MLKTKAKAFDPDEFLFDLYAMSREKVEKIFWKEFDKTKPNFEKIKFMIDSGIVDVSVKNEWGATPLLYLAGGWNDLDLAKFLLDKGADLEAKCDDGNTPLHLACGDYSDSYEFVKLLIERGANVRAEDRDGFTALHFASEVDAIKCAKLLLDKGADVRAENNWGETPIDMADSEEMKTLLKNKKTFGNLKNIV